MNIKNTFELAAWTESPEGQELLNDVAKNVPEAMDVYNAMATLTIVELAFTYKLVSSTSPDSANPLPWVIKLLNNYLIAWQKRKAVQQVLGKGD